MTEEEESKRRQAEFELRTKLFMDTLDLDEFFAQLLVSEGFTNLEEVAYVELTNCWSSKVLTKAQRANCRPAPASTLRRMNKRRWKRPARWVSRIALLNFEGLTPQMLEALAEDGVKTLEDFATCADWELAGGWTTEGGERKKDDGVLEKFEVSLEEAQTMVMTARVMLGWVDPADLVSDEDDDTEEDEA